ncbi:MAG: phosphoglucomutase [Termitinemataceae bacterium]|nr:MAG: phosphoglucomutase [Termitinemataceae bacterium]
MILSASGWRDIFAADGNEESRTKEISDAHKQFAHNAAKIFSQYLIEKNPNLPIAIIVGMDTRPTGEAIASSVISAITDAGCTPLFAGITAAPEIMAIAKLSAYEPAPLNNVRGFIFISASHNPIGHNGIKFGKIDGGVLEGSEAQILITRYKNLTGGVPPKLQTVPAASTLDTVPAASVSALRDDRHSFSAAPVALSPELSSGKIKDAALRAYRRLTDEIVLGDTNYGAAKCLAAIKCGLQKRQIGVCADFNGSARTMTIDKDYFESYGIKFKSMNSTAGMIAHKIVPEDDALIPCCRFLESLHKDDPSFVLGYVPDCDGDRGNLVIWDDQLNAARALEAQEVFALAVLAELSFAAWMGYTKNLAVAVNDPTSMRVDAICERFDAEVYRAEVGEANVVGLGRKLRKDGKIVRIVGEGSAGGNITHPSSVRDPLDTVMALVKLLAIRQDDIQQASQKNEMGLFEIWCGKLGGKKLYRNDFTLADVLATLPQFSTTGAYTSDAVLKIDVRDHARFKDEYQKLFLYEWDVQRDFLKTNYGIEDWEAVAYNGMVEKRSISIFSTAQKGGLKIYFKNAAKKSVAAIWMRGSATEPVFRIMADAESSSGISNNSYALERHLIKWQRGMVIETQKICSQI